MFTLKNKKTMLSFFGLLALVIGMGFSFGSSAMADSGRRGDDDRFRFEKRFRDDDRDVRIRIEKRFDRDDRDFDRHHFRRFDDHRGGNSGRH